MTPTPDDGRAGPPAAARPGGSRLAEDFAATARDFPPEPEPDGVIGRTTFDAPGSEDHALTVLLSREKLQHAPAQALVRVESRPDGRRYLGVVTAGPFAVPDTLRADSPVLTAVATHGGRYLPPHHGRVQVQVLGEQLADGALVPPRLRPLPHSPVFRLTDAEAASVLKADGDLRLGLAVGHDALTVGVPSGAKAVLPRHTAVLGTTGGGKSTTIAGLVKQAQAAGMAVVLLDIEGEYTFLHEPTDDPPMLAALRGRGLPEGGIPAEQMALYHLAGRDTTNPGHPNRREFSLQFARLSPYVALEMLGCNDAQTDRFLYAYEVAKALARELGIFPETGKSAEERARQERLLRRIDEFERGYPRLTLSFFLDVVAACKAVVTKAEFRPFNGALQTDTAREALAKHLDAKHMPGNAASWGKLHSLLWRLNRLRVFYGPGVRPKPLNYADLIRPGRVSVIDLSDAGLSELTNIALSDLLRGVQEAQESAYRAYEEAKRGGRDAAPPPRVLVIVEEAHEFLSEERIDKTPVLFQQLSRIAKRGRKRWLGLTFVTQLPQHLPRQVLGLCNNFILHKLTDPQVVANLRKAIAGIDDGLWSRLPGLAPGQAVVSFAHMTRPLLTSIDPTGAKLRLVD
jgi:DNA helicase HerA-like ATPase